MYLVLTHLSNSETRILKELGYIIAISNASAINLVRLDWVQFPYEAPC